MNATNHIYFPKRKSLNDKAEIGGLPSLKMDEPAVVAVDAHKLHTFVGGVRDLDIMVAIENFNDLGELDRIRYIRTAFEVPIDLEATASLEDHVKSKILNYFENINFYMDQIRFFEEFIFATMVISPDSLMAIIIKSLAITNDDLAIKQYLGGHEYFKSSFVSHAIDVYLEAGVALDASLSSLEQTLSFSEFFSACAGCDATKNSILFPSPGNISRLAESPYVLEYLAFLESNGLMHKLMSGPNYELLLYACSKKAQISARNVLIRKKLGAKSASYISLIWFFSIAIAIDFAAGVITIICQTSGLMLTAGILKLAAYLDAAVATYILESEFLTYLYVLAISTSNGLFAISWSELGAYKWIIFGVQLLPVIVALKASDCFVLPLAGSAESSHQIGKKVRALENQVFSFLSFISFLVASFALSAAVSLINIIFMLISTYGSLHF